MLLPYHAWEMVHAIVLTLIRLVITQRRLLEWETAASVAVRLSGDGPHGVAHLRHGNGGEPVHRDRHPRRGRRSGPPSLSVALPFVPVDRGTAFAYLLSRPVGAAASGPSRHHDRHRLRRIAERRGTTSSSSSAGEPLAAARQLPGDAGRRPRAADVAHEHRHGAVVDAGGARPRLHRHRRAGRAARKPWTPSNGSSATKAIC